MDEVTTPPLPQLDVHHYWTAKIYHLAAYIDTEVTDPVKRAAVEAFLETTLETALKVWLQP
jgi:hypothetical protein